MDRARANALISKAWDESIVPTLQEYIRIPNKSPAFDPEWAEHGHMEKAVAADRRLVPQRSRSRGSSSRSCACARPHAGDLHGDPRQRRPDTVLLYGHLDKQPPR